MSISTVLFDLDGTLLDTAQDFAQVLNHLRQRHNRPPLSFASIREQVSNGARALVKLGFDLDEGDSEYEFVRQQLLDYYSLQLDVETRPFNGIDELLEQLEARRIPWGIVTNKPRQYTAPLLESLRLAERCDAVVCPEDVSQKKPHPEPLLLACEQMGVEATEAVYIGDHRRDIEAGKNAGMKTIAALYGYIEASEDASSWAADFVVQSAADIGPILFEHPAFNASH